MTNTFHTPLNLCPCCSQKLDAVTAVDNQQVEPTEGDITICLYCGTILEFDGSLSVTIFRDFDGLTDESKDQLTSIQQMITKRNQEVLQ